jgi:FixJ family two-component response regulator
VNAVELRVLRPWLTAEPRPFRERPRLEAVERFVRGDCNAVIARELRVRARSVQWWRERTT